MDRTKKAIMERNNETTRETGRETSREKLKDRILTRAARRVLNRTDLPLDTKIHLDFTGYWRETSSKWMPATPGIFCVYRCTYNERVRTVMPKQLLFIGESVSVRDALASPEQRALWKAMLVPGEQLCFTFAPIIMNRRRAQTALVHAHQPVCNAAPTEPYPFAQTDVILSGRIPLLRFSVTIPAQSQTSSDGNSEEEESEWLEPVAALS